MSVRLLSASSGRVLDVYPGYLSRNMRINEANLLLGADLLQARKHYLQSQVTEIRREMGDLGNDGRSKNCPAGLDHGSELSSVTLCVSSGLI